MNKKKRPSLIVGVGASAGGLAVLKKFMHLLPKDSGMSFIIIQHLDPNHKSMLSELLAKQSTISVEDAHANQKIERDHAYVTPPDAYLEIVGNKIKLVQPEHARGTRKAIDHFFRSMARECSYGCVGIVLSGAGSDGTAGLRAIKASGGLALAQDPDTAEYENMPLSAMKAGVIDKVVAIEEIPEVLLNYVNHPLTMDKKEENLDKDSRDSIQEITNILKIRENFNLRQYKRGTVHRRIARRMSLTGLSKYTDYLERLRESDEERTQLTKDLLINVTDFFRDPEAHQVLENEVVPEIIKNAGEEDIRVWSAGCASGEEAYSLAILLIEGVEKAKKNNGITIFATDIDEHAIKIARKGAYPESIAEKVPSPYLEKYFKKNRNETGYKIIGRIRDLVSFATQNVAIHPPFSKIDLISCRNLLIYFKKEVQEKALSSFYFALKNSGYLFLGSSESLGTKLNHYKSISKKWRIYKKVPGRDERPPVMLNNLNEEKLGAMAFDDQALGGKHRNKRASITRIDNIRGTIMDAVVPPMVVVDYEGKILYNHGELRPYLRIPSGEPRNEIIQMLIPGLRPRVRSGLYKVKKRDVNLSFQCVIPADEVNAEKKTIRIELLHLRNHELADGKAIGVVFHEGKNIGTEQNTSLTKDDVSQADQNLELELAETKQELQNTIEELETSGEELKASHEEALSTNEELQSANEELEASSEELRSLNEELSTVNAQLKDKIGELQDANNDVENFFASTNLPTVFLNPELQIQRYTPAAEQLLKMGPQDLGRPVYSLGRELVDDDLANECQQVLQNFLPVKKEKKTYDDRWYIRQVSPYRTEDRRIEGVVLVFQDVTEIKQLSKRAESREKQQSVVANLGIMALSGQDPEEIIHHAVREVAHVLEADYCKVLKYQPEEQNLLMVAGIGWQEGLVGKATVPSDKNSQAGYTLLHQGPVIVKRLSKEKRFQGPELLIEHKVVSGISCLINHMDPPFGVLGVHCKEYREFTQEDANFLVSVANMLSTAIRTKQDRERIDASELQFRTLANSIPQLVWMADKTGYIYWYNQRWYDYAGTSLDEVKGWGWKKVHHPDYVDQVERKYKKHIESGELWEDTFPLRDANGQYHWFLSRAKPITNAEGEITHWFGTNTDIDIQLELEASLKKAIAELEETDKRKNEFLAILGHELRNPLGALNGSVHVLETEVEAPQEIINIMQRSIRTMAKLLDDLLDLSRVTRNTIHLDVEKVDLTSLLNDKVTELNKQFQTKHQQIKPRIDKGLFMEGDHTRVEQIFTNLLNNASKFTPEKGAVEVAAWNDNELIHVRVSDEGIGIDGSIMDKIFDPFYQITPLGKSASGLGIGLSLVKNLTELHGGSVEVYSEGKNKGTTFIVKFPRLRKDHKLSNAKNNSKEPEVEPRLIVVLVDDNEDILFTLSAILKGLKCEVFTANTAEKGIKVIKEKHPDVAFVDIGLPDSSGHQVAATLRASGFDNVLIAASGYGHKEARERSTNAGFDYHLAKPLSVDTIKNTLSKVTKSSR